jgi:hypothetical protein
LLNLLVRRCKIFILDIETLGVESTSVILSTALLYFDEKQEYNFDELVSKCCFVKFDANDQIKNYKRTVDKGTIEWWKGQAIETRKLSISPSENDVSTEKGIKLLKEYIRDNSVEKKEICWIRGTIDQTCTESLCRSLGVPPLFEYYQFRDIRTALDLLKETTKRGYCKVPGFDYSKVAKHNPIHDVSLDTMMLLYGE